MIVEVTGGDAALAAAVAGGATRVRFVPAPDSDLARAVGLVPGHAVTSATPVDVLRLAVGEPVIDVPVVNMAVLGRPPDRLRRHHRAHECVVEVDGRRVWDGPATTVVLANGEHLRGLDLVPRGHPADGRFEVHVYAMAPGQRAAMRRRLPAGTHLPHPGIRTFHGRSVSVRWERPSRLEADGVERGTTRALEAAIEPGVLTLEP